MSTHEAIAALPTGADADAALIRAMCTRRFAYVLTAAESAQDFVAVDPTSGVVPLYLLQKSTLFAYDSTDSTTAHDGVTCLVSSDGKRFKSDTIAPPYSVLDKDLIAQPASPAVGDRYLIPTAATGTDWAGKDGKIGIYTAAGWRFAVSPVGRLLHVEDETAFYHRNVSGVWTAGLGSIVLAANSVNITNVLGANASYVVKVENQTTNAPPASPVAPVAYIIGSSPTGAWSGNAGKVAMCLVAGAFTILTPVAGDVVYDKALAKAVTYTGTAWDAANNAFVLLDTQTASGSASVEFSSTYLTDTYDEYEIHLISIKNDINNTALLMRVGNGAGPTYPVTGYRHAATYLNEDGVSPQVSASDTSILLCYNAGVSLRLGNASGRSLNGVIRFNNPETTNYNQFMFDVVYAQANGAGSGRLIGVGRYDAQLATTGIRFLFSTGVIASGRFSLYGVRKS